MREDHVLNIVLYRPEIPANTGNIGRTCVVAGARLHIIGPLTFDMSHERVLRAGLNYWNSVDLVMYDSWDDFIERNPGARLHLLTKRGRTTYSDATYQDGDYLVFGRESTGLPRDIMAAYDECCERIPMLPDAVALNDAEEWAARHESLKLDISGNFVEDDHAGISSLNLGNCVCIVLYEALRQIGFPGMDCQPPAEYHP